MSKNLIIKSIFSTMIIALVFSIYEYSMFYFIFAPLIQKTLNNTFYNLSLNNKKTANTNPLNIPEELQVPVLKILSRRESKFSNKINNFTVFAAIAMIIFILMIIAFCYYYIKSKNDYINKSVWATVVITLIFILTLQYLSYIFTNKYQYIVSKVDNSPFSPEIEHELNKYILNNSDPIDLIGTVNSYNNLMAETEEEKITVSDLQNKA